MISHPHKPLVSHPLPFPFLRYPIPPLHLLCPRLSSPPALALSLSLKLRRHPYIDNPPRPRFIQCNNKKKSSIINQPSSKRSKITI